MKREIEVQSTRMCEILEQKRQAQDEKRMIEDDKRKITKILDAKDDEIIRLTKTHYNVVNQILGVNNEIGRKME